MRGLSESFMESLLGGELFQLLEVVKSDHTTCLAIRKDYINIYYRGGNLLKISSTPQGYVASFDKKYYTDKTIVPQLSTGDYQGWLEQIPIIKAEMDSWFALNRKSEREFQQLVLRENNFSSVSGDTDYYIADLEYETNRSRFDMLAVKLLSTSQDRKKLEGSLAFIEMKYGDGALSGKSGVQKHFSDLQKHFSVPDNR